MKRIPYRNNLVSNSQTSKDEQIKTRVIKENRKENENQRNNNNCINKKILIPIIIISSMGLIALILILIFTIKKNKPRGVYHNISFLNYEEAKTLLNSEMIENNHLLLNNVLNNLNNSITLCQKLNITDIPSEINYTSPDFLVSPTKSDLKLVKNDLDLYKDKYEELSKEVKVLVNSSTEFLVNLSYSIENIKDEVNNLIYQFENLIRNISIPLFYMKKISQNNRILNEDINSINDKLSLFDKIEEYKNESEILNNLYNKMFKYLEESFQVIHDEILEFPNSIIELQNEVENGMIKFEEIIEKFNDPNDVQSLDQNLKTIKNNFITIKNELMEKQQKMENRIKKVENSYIIDRNRIKLKKIKDESNEILGNLKIKSKSINDDIIEKSKSNYLDSVKIPDLYFSNIVCDSIYEILNNSMILIIGEEIEINNKFEIIKSSINVEQKTSLDLLFIMDLTGSMKPYTDQVKQNLFNIINKIILECPGVDLNIGFIGFRDVINVCDPVDLEFTQNHEELKKSISTINYNCDGDNYSEEDVEQGFELALNKDWKSIARIAILATDNPCHGSKYSSNVNDPYPNGNPNAKKNIEILIKELAEKDISLFCMKITDKTDKMFGILKTIYNNYKNCKFEVAPLESVDDLPNVAIASSNNIYMNQRNILR